MTGQITSTLSEHFSEQNERILNDTDTEITDTKLISMKPDKVFISVA